MSWADLPAYLLRLISGRLSEAGDFLRFHSACQAWRDAAPATLPQFLPWVLASGRDYPPSAAQLRSIFSKTTWCAPRTLRNRWLAADDGAGAWLLTSEAGPPPSLRLVDPFTGAAAALLPPFAGRAGGHIPYSNGFVLADGAVILSSIESFHKRGCFVMAAVHRPGDAAWAEGRQEILTKYTSFSGSCVCAAAYHDGEIVLVDLLQVHTVKLRVVSGGNGGGGNVVDVIATTSREDPPWNCFLESQPQPQRIYTFKSRGELLAACLLLDTTGQDGGADPGALAGAMSVSVYALDPGEDGGGGGDPQWVARDARSLRDRVLFLGCPTSSVVDVARLGGAAVGGGGGAHFVLSSRKPGVARRNVPEACHVYRYSFEDGRATAVEELPTCAGWDNDALMTWLAPRPSAIAPVRIRERLLQDPNKQHGAPCTTSIIRAPRAVFGPPFTFFVGNLPSGVGSLKLEQFFAGFGKVTDARVKSNSRHEGVGFYYAVRPCCMESYASGYWGFGFVTMAPIGEPDDVFAALDGKASH